MKKIYLLALVFIFIFSVFIYAEDDERTWDEEDKVNKLPGEIETGSCVAEDNGSIVDVEDFIFNLGIHSPVNSWAAAVDFRSAFLIKEKFRLGITGYFFNELPTYEEKDEKLWWEDASGAEDELKNEDKNKEYDWDNIDNQLYVYLGLKMKNNVHLAFMLGGGTDINDYHTIEDAFTASYDAAGAINAPYTKTVKSEIIRGYGFVDLGVGIKFENAFFKTPLIKYLSIYEKATLQINGNQDLSGTLGSTKTETEWYSVASDAKESENVIDNQYNYFGFYNNGGVLLNLDLKNSISALGVLEEFNIGVGLDYYIGLRYYSNYYQKDNTDYVLNSTVNTHLAGEHANETFDYKIDAYLNGGFSIPLFFELKPAKAVEMKLSYRPELDITYYKYERNHSMDEEDAGVDVSYEDPTYTYQRTIYNITHNIGMRFRFIFPKVVRLSIGGTFRIAHNITDTEEKQDSDVRKWANGTETPVIPGSNEIIDEKNKSGNIDQTINPFLELDFEIVKDLAVITIGWSPNIAFILNVDTNLLNLANWYLSCIIKFDHRRLK